MSMKAYACFAVTNSFVVQMSEGRKVCEASELRRAISYYQEGCVLVVVVQPSLAYAKYG